MVGTDTEDQTAAPEQGERKGEYQQPAEQPRGTTDQTREPRQKYAGESGSGKVLSLPKYVGSGSLVQKLSQANGKFAETDAFLLRDSTGNPIRDPGANLYGAAVALAWAYRAAGESDARVMELAEKMYRGFAEGGLESFLGALEGRAPKPRRIPEGMPGYLIHQSTPKGSLHAHFTIDPLRNYDPLELFLSVGKAGEEEVAQTEALGRLISHMFRTKKTTKDVLDQIGGLSSSKAGVHKREGYITTIERGVEMAIKKYDWTRDIFGMERVLTGVFDPDYITEIIADAIKKGEIPEYVTARDSSQILVDLKGKGNGIIKPVQLNIVPGPSGKKPVMPPNASPDHAPIGKEDIPKVHINGAERCPDCEQQALVPQAGCNKCVACGYSDCG